MNALHYNYSGRIKNELNHETKIGYYVQKCIATGYYLIN